MSASSWKVRAACSGSDPELFHTTADEGEAKRVCGRCRVQRQCQDYAVADASLQGVWGGTNAQERTALRRSATR